MNILVSGWPGVGQTTLSLILASRFKFRLIQGSNTFRYLWKELGLDKTAKDRIKADELVQTYWGRIYEKYVDYILENDDKLVLESDIAGFRKLDKTKIFSIFLVANNEVRNTRLKEDKRGDEVKTLEERDLLLKNEYKQMFNADFFDLNIIKLKYSFLLDNSKLSISEELELISREMHNQRFINLNLDKKKSHDFLKEEEDFKLKGKKWYLEMLNNDQLIPSAEELIKEIKRIFPEEINLLPSKIKKIINKL